MADIWDRMDDWSLVLPPSRPSYEQLNYFCEFLKPYPRDTAVAVLGCTPEYRDLLFRLGFHRIYLLERSKEFFEIVSPLCLYASGEKIIWGDWLETLPELAGTFGVILSDLTSGNIPYGRRGEFYSSINAALKDGGIFCDKILTHPRDPISLDDIYDSYRWRPLNLLTANWLNCQGIFCSAVLSEMQDLDTTRAYRLLEGLSDEPSWQRLLNLTQRITPMGGTWYYGLPWVQIQQDLHSNLTLLAESEDIPSSAYSGWVKWMVWGKS